MANSFNAAPDWCIEILSPQQNQTKVDAKADRQRIDTALARGDRDRAINENEHRTFRETFQPLLAEVARIWQRLEKISTGAIAAEPEYPTGLS